VYPGGTYSERIVLRSSIILEAEPGASVNLKWSTSEPYQSSIEVVSGARASVRGFTILHSSPSVANNYAVYVKSRAQLDLTDCDINSATGSGVGVDGGSVAVVDSYVHDCARNGLIVAGDLEGGMGTARIQRSRIVYNRSDGIIALDGSHVQLQSTSVCRNEKAGMDVRVCSRWLLVSP
jgi:Right handed beta helix region